MLKYFYRKIRTLWKKPARHGDIACDWCSDPLGHPALHQMSQRELGDLPFDPHCFR